MPSHLKPMPLIISFNFSSPVPSLSKKILLLALQHRDRVCAISIGHWGLGDLELRRVLDNDFPMLETLSISNDHVARVPPKSFAARHLRTLHLRNIAIDRGCLLLACATNLLSLRLERIPSPGDFPPEYLVERIASMPHLENLSISFLQNMPLPYTVMELRNTQTPFIVIPRLSRFIYIGIGTYLEKVLARIRTPLLQDFRFTSSLDGIFAVLSLSAFLDTMQNLNFQKTLVSFSTLSTAIAYHFEQPPVDGPYFVFNVLGIDNRLGALDSVVKICSAVAPVLPDVESLVLESDYDCLRFPRFVVKPALWQSFLRSFGGVKTLRADMAFTAELSETLRADNGLAIKELLPVVSKLIVVSHVTLVHEPFYSFISARRLAGHSIDLQVIQHYPPSLRPPPISWPFDTFPEGSNPITL